MAADAGAPAADRAAGAARLHHRLVRHLDGSDCGHSQRIPAVRRLREHQHRSARRAFIQSMRSPVCDRRPGSHFAAAAGRPTSRSPVTTTQLRDVSLVRSAIASEGRKCARAEPSREDPRKINRPMEAAEQLGVRSVGDRVRAPERHLGNEPGREERRPLGSRAGEARTEDRQLAGRYSLASAPPPSLFFSSVTSLRTVCAKALSSCIALRTRVPAALLPSL